MTPEKALKELEVLGNEKMRAQNTRNGAGDHQFGVRLGDIRKVAKGIKADHALSLALWETGNIEGRLLASLQIKPQDLAPEELDRMVRSITCPPIWIDARVSRQV